MTTRTQQRSTPRWALAFLAALVAVLAIVGLAGSASAVSSPTAGTRVGASSVVVEVLVGPSEYFAAGQRLGNSVAGPEIVVATGVAANAAPEALSFGSRAAAREGLPGDLATAGNRFFRGATSKSQDFSAVGLPGGGYRLQFFSPANNPGYGKLYVQEIDRTGQVLREYKNTMGPDGLIETKWVHGGP